MKKKYKRKNYLVHTSSQVKYILLSILPALVITVFSMVFLVRAGEAVFNVEKERISSNISSINNTIDRLERGNYPPVIGREIDMLKKKLLSSQENMNLAHFGALRQWKRVKMLVFMVLSLLIICASIIALLHSHRIAGPLFRLKRCIDILSEGKDTDVIEFRNEDEFKELGRSLEKLRVKLKDAGYLKRPH